LSRQRDFFSDAIAHAKAAHWQEKTRIATADAALIHGEGWLRKEACDFFPEGKPPITTDTQRALRMLYTLCDWLEELLLRPLTTHRHIFDFQPLNTLIRR